MRRFDFNIQKTDKDKHLVFGWANIALDTDGETIVDSEGDVIEPGALEDAAYTHVLEFRSTGEEHIKSKRDKGWLVESCVFTKEKQRAIGIPEKYVPVGWWVGYKIYDNETWDKIKSGKYAMFSIEGRGMREPITKAVRKPRTFAEILRDDINAQYKRRVHTFGEILKADIENCVDIRKRNPYHAKDGKFTFAPGGRKKSTGKSGSSKSVRLAKDEYSKVCSEINTNYGRYKGKKICRHATVYKNRYYNYHFENRGFDDYNIFKKEKI